MTLSDKIVEKDSAGNIVQCIQTKFVREAVKKLIVLANTEEDLDTRDRWRENINEIFGEKLI